MATLVEKLQLTLDCKNEIKTVMKENLGLEVTDFTPLSEYATKLKTVKLGSGDSGSTKIPALAMTLYTDGTSNGEFPFNVSNNTITLSVNNDINVPSDEHNFKLALYKKINNSSSDREYETLVADTTIDVTYKDITKGQTTKTFSLAESNEFCLYNVSGQSDFSTVLYDNISFTIKFNDTLQNVYGLYTTVTSFVNDSEG